LDQSHDRVEIACGGRGRSRCGVKIGREMWFSSLEKTGGGVGVGRKWSASRIIDLVAGIAVLTVDAGLRTPIFAVSD
jgi:hypothetical protein